MPVLNIMVATTLTVLSRAGGTCFRLLYVADHVQPTSMHMSSSVAYAVTVVPPNVVVKMKLFYFSLHKTQISRISMQVVIYALHLHGL